MQKQTLISLALTSLLTLTSINSYAEVTANMAASSNYYWRGVTQSADQAAISGGVDYANEAGFYAGGWASNIDFGPTTSASYELDLYAGFSQSIESSITRSIRRQRHYVGKRILRFVLE